MERWQKIERCLAEFFRNHEFEVDQQGDVFADQNEDENGGLNLTLLAKEIDRELGK